MASKAAARWRFTDCTEFALSMVFLATTSSACRPATMLGSGMATLNIAPRTRGSSSTIIAAPPLAALRRPLRIRCRRPDPLPLCRAWRATLPPVPARGSACRGKPRQRQTRLPAARPRRLSLATACRRRRAL
eukprot:scaffold15127_cov90-Isochrysis_galbana.AAC.1